MKVYRVHAYQGNVSFTRQIKAVDLSDARNKFFLEVKKADTYLLPFYPDDTKITSITRRY